MQRTKIDKKRVKDNVHKNLFEEGCNCFFLSTDVPYCLFPVAAEYRSNIYTSMHSKYHLKGFPINYDQFLLLYSICKACRYHNHLPNVSRRGEKKGKSGIYFLRLH